MYARLSDIEILSSYVSEVSVGDLLTVQALVTNPLDWQYFYEKISTIRKGDRTNFMIVTKEGDRLQGTGDIVEVERWSNHNKYGFKVKIRVKKQKSLTDRRTRTERKEIMTAPISEKKLEITPAEPKVPTPYIEPEEVTAFKDMLKGSLAMDMSV
jgi:hypothetical protein